MKGIRGVTALFAAAGLFAVPAAAAALPFTGNSRSYLSTWESADSEQHLALYEYLDGELKISGDGRITFHFGGWGRVDLAEESYGDSSAGELQYGYLHYATGRNNAGIRLGRVAVSEGVARAESLDGFHAAGDLARGVSLAAYGGLPVEADGDGRGGDFISGGRLALERPGLFELGASYLREENDGSDFREEFGVDSRLRIGPFLEVQGLSGFNAIRSSWMEHDYRLALGPFQGMTLVGEAGWIDYESYFQSPSSSAFDVAVIGAEESLLALGGTLEYAFATAFSVTLSYHDHRYDRADDAKIWGGEVSWNTPAAALGLSFRRVDGSTARLRFSEVRGYASRRIGRFDLVLDALNDHYDEDVRGVADAYALSLALGYEPSDRLRVAADFEYGSNPALESDIKVLCKLEYRFSAFSANREEER